MKKARLLRYSSLVTMSSTRSDDGVFAGFQLLDDEELEATGLLKASDGPVGVPESIIVAADQNLEKIARWVVGANEDGFHYVGAAQGEDFKVDVWAVFPRRKQAISAPPAARRSKKRVVSRFRRSSSLAISIPKRSARSILQKMAPTSHSSWAAMAWASPVRSPR